MRYHLLPTSLHEEICELLPVWLRQVVASEEAFAESLRRGGSLVAYSNVIPGSEDFAQRINTLPVFTLNKWGLPCNPEGGEAVSSHRLLAADQLPYLARVLERVGENGLAIELQETPALDVPDRFQFGSGGERFAVEHWTQSQAEAVLAAAHWLQGKEFGWEGTSGGYAIGGIECLPVWPDPDEPDALVLDLEECERALAAGETIAFSTRWLRMETVLAMQAQIEAWGYRWEQDGDNVQVVKETVTVSNSDEIPF